MRILLLSHAVIPAFAQAFNSSKYTNSAGWVVGIYNELKKSDCEVALVSPFEVKEKTSVRENNVSFYAFPRIYKDTYKINPKHKNLFREILQEFKPDIVMIFGTEYTQGYSMLLACEAEKMINHAVIFTQGLISAIARYYEADIPYKEVRKKSLRECINHMDIYSQRKAFERRGETEKKMIRLAKHIIGGTVWDKNVIQSINPTIQYYHCAEILRSGFYENRWKLEKCERFSLFAVPSSVYPVKGLHYLIEGMSGIVKKYPTAKLYLTMTKPRLPKTFKDKINVPSYERYIATLIDRNALWGNIVFLGQLHEKELLNRYLKAHVFLCSSSIENHSQTVSEAKLLGVPTIATFVGGLVERIEQGQDGFLYQHNAPYMIVEYIQRIFEDDELANYLSENAHKKAMAFLDQEKNMKNLFSIFDQVKRQEETKI